MLSFYPAVFRKEYGVEMQKVFAQAIEDRSREGIVKTLVFYLREIKDLPRNLFSQHRLETRKEGSPMTAVSETNQIDKLNASTTKHNPGSWGAACLAGLPHLLIPLIGVGKFLHNGGFYQFSQNALAALGISLGLLVAIILVYAWRRGWPLWSASWYSYWLFILMAISTYVIVELDLNQSWRYTNALFLGWIAVWGIGYLYLFFRDRLRALLTIFFLIPLLGVMMLEFIPDPIEGWLAVSLGLLTALTAATIVRLGSYRVTLGLVIGVNLIAALVLAYIGE